MTLGEDQHREADQSNSRLDPFTNPLSTGDLLNHCHIGEFKWKTQSLQFYQIKLPTYFWLLLLGSSLETAWSLVAERLTGVRRESGVAGRGAPGDDVGCSGSGSRGCRLIKVRTDAIYPGVCAPTRPSRPGVGE